jgi:hypothetical protein
VSYDCLKGFIGIRYQGAPVPDSNVYINELPGITLKGIESIASQDQTTFLGVWADVEKRSLKTLKTAVTNYFSKRYQLVTINESLRLPDYWNTEKPTAPAAEYRGFTFDLGWWGSDFAAIHIEDLRLYLTAPQTGLVIKVMNVYSNYESREIDSFTIDAVEGWNVIKVRKTYAETSETNRPFKIFVGYDATNIESVYMPLNGLMNGGPYYDQLSLQWTPLSPYQGILRAASWAQTGNNNLSQGVNLYGLSGSVSVVCSWDSILCQNKEVFTTVLWYILGMELMAERMFSDRVNRYTTIDLNKAKELHDYFKARLAEEMMNVFDGIDLMSWDGCTKCNAQVQLQTQLP